MQKIIQAPNLLYVYKVRTNIYFLLQCIISLIYQGFYKVRTLINILTLFLLPTLPDFTHFYKVGSNNNILLFYSSSFFIN